MEPFLLRALAASVGLAVVAAPLGCIVVWSRMAYFGETIAQASLLGVALALFLKLDTTLGVLAVALAIAGLLALIGRQKELPLDSILGLLHHGALAAGVIATALVKGPSVDLMGYLFGDVFAVTREDLAWVFGGGALVLGCLWWLWPSLLRLAVHDELAAAEGVDRDRVRVVFMLLLSLTIAVAIKIVGALLVIAFLIVPVVAARPFAATPERMAVLAALIGASSSAIGLGASTRWDIPGGAAIVLAMALAAGVALSFTRNPNRSA
jgi:zinc transport system permease protein